MFATEEEGKRWLIEDLVTKGIADNWYDPDDDCCHTTPETIREALKKCTLKEIVEGIRDGEVQIEMVSN
jgi:hypothetical protein